MGITKSIFGKSLEPEARQETIPHKKVIILEKKYLPLARFGIEPNRRQIFLEKPPEVRHIQDQLLRPRESMNILVDLEPRSDCEYLDVGLEILRQLCLYTTYMFLLMQYFWQPLNTNRYRVLFQNLKKE